MTNDPGKREGAKNQGTDLLKIPGVGENMKEHLQKLGYTCIEELKGENPLEMYERDRIRLGGTLDRCVLYVYRCAVYFAQTQTPDREKLDWWYWKDKTLGDETI